jgi:hypothetical protein
VQEIFFGKTRGYDNPAMTLDDLAADWDRVVDRTDPTWFVDAVPYVVPPWITKAYAPT